MDPSLVASPKTLQAAAAYVSIHDHLLASVIAKVGLCTIQPHTNYYQALVQSIVSQQLSILAAAAIEKRFVALFHDSFPTPANILSKDVETLRSAGLSRAKATYIQDLASHVLDGSIHFEHLDRLTNDEIIIELTAVKGIGEWTVHMFLIFCMGRLDVLPVGDLGIKNGVRRLYNLEMQPVAADDIAALAKANQWAPYQSVACWYIWQSLKLPIVAASIS
jgi:DNA-3-methyladenine glycosylase II